MKSSVQELEKRGFVSEEMLSSYKDEPKEILWQHLFSSSALKRTVAVSLLPLIEEKNHCAFVFLSCLREEKALYTKLAICQFLAMGDAETLFLMIPYLGEIGHNQYQELPSKPSLKKSYPLPRDIIARTIARMNPNLLEVLFQVLEQEPGKRLELIDAIGFLLFYHPELASEKRFLKIVSLIEEDRSNLLLVWKAILCLSAFSLEQTVSYLLSLQVELVDPLLKEEIARSLKIIKKRGVS